MKGTPFGRYVLLDLLGRGGMGEVWRAHDSATDRVVAIKTLPAQYSDDKTFQERFRREAQAAARLNSPHVIPIHDYGEIDGRLFVCMRLIEGRDLQAVLVDGAISPSRAVRIIEQVAKALQAAHDIGLVHRDVKPSNVLLDKDDFAYLIDFGIARATDDTRLTGTGNAIGTFQYMAPERMADSPDDARADIYALACVLYECLTGAPPFAGSNMASVVAAHLHTPPPRPSTSRSDVPASLDPVIATGMAKAPEDRYGTTVELATAAHDAITTPRPHVPLTEAFPRRPAPVTKVAAVRTPPVPRAAQPSAPIAAPSVAASPRRPLVHRPRTVAAATILAFACAALSLLAAMAILGQSEGLEARGTSVGHTLALTMGVVANAGLAAYLVWGGINTWRGNHRMLMFAPIVAIVAAMFVVDIRALTIDGVSVALSVLVSLLLFTGSSKDFFYDERLAREEP